MKHSTRAPTKYEAERIEAMKRLGCVACAVLGVPNLNHLELHHILDGGVRMGHWFSIFLCRGHHQGDWSQIDIVDAAHRVAISDGRKRFRLIYGTERELWERVQNKLKLAKVWPVSKRVPRGGNHELSSDVVEFLASAPPTPQILPRSTEASAEAGTGSATAQGDRA